MPADHLREKLGRLVEEWRARQNQRGFWETANIYPYQLYGYVADQLAALLAESEPEAKLRSESLDICPGCGVTARHLHETWIDTDGAPHTCADMTIYED